MFTSGNDLPKIRSVIMMLKTVFEVKISFQSNQVARPTLYYEIDLKRNGYIFEELGVESSVNNIQKNIIGNHASRMENTRISKLIISYKPTHRRPGRPLLGFIDGALTGVETGLIPDMFILYCINRVVIAAQCTATFQDLLCFPEFRYYKDVNMPIKFCSEAYFSRLEVL